LEPIAVTETFTLTPEHRAEFGRVGVLRLPGFLPSANVTAMADSLWADLRSRYGAERHDSKTWPVQRPSHFQAVVRSGAFAGLGTPELHQLGDALLGVGAWTAPKRPSGRAWREAEVGGHAQAAEGRGAMAR
jgi:hypothetical protein